MISDDIARRFAFRPGFRLVDYRDVALPIFKLKVRALALEEKAVPPIQEYVLKAIDHNLTVPTDIAGLLGISEPVARRSIVSLLRSDDIVVMGNLEDSRSQRLALTNKGRETLSQAKTIVPRESILSLVLDGLTRRTSVDFDLDLVAPRDLRDLGLWEIAPNPKRMPDMADLALEQVRAAVRQREQQLRRKGPQILDLLEIVERGRFFRTDALALVYTGLDEDSIQVGFVVGERRSEEHELAFAQLPKSRGYDEMFRELIGADARQLASAGVRDPDAILTDRLLAERNEATTRVAELEDSLRTEPHDFDQLQAELSAAKARADAAEAALVAITDRSVEVYEHPRFLRQALTAAAERLLIVSPWIKASVVDGELLRELEGALRRGVQTFIIYGIDAEERRQTPKDKEAIQKLVLLSSRYSNFHLKRLGDTHAKVLICDHRFLITTSFNWLSFKGDPNMPFRDERGAYHSRPNCIDEEWDYWFKRATA